MFKQGNKMDMYVVTRCRITNNYGLAVKVETKICKFSITMDLK